MDNRMEKVEQIQMKDVSIIIPAYNEEGGIRSTLEELKADEQLKDCEIIVIDDGSKDKTYEEAASVTGVRVLRHRVNRGYGTAIATGSRACTGKIIAWYDADGQHRPEDLVKVLRKMMDEDLDYCIGVRGKDSFVDKSRVLGKSVLKTFVNWMAKEPMGDFNSGMRAFKRDVFMRYVSLLPKRFGASTVTTFIMQERYYIGAEVPIVVRQRVGKSTVKQVRDGLRTISLIMNIILLFRPMEVFGTAGIFTILLGSVYGIVRAVLGGRGIPTLAAIVILFGIQILFFGVFSSQISQLRIERFDDK